MKKFAKVNLPKACKEIGIGIQDLFNCIIIAPRSLQNVDTLKEFLINGGYDKLAESISKSNCPLR